MLFFCHAVHSIAKFVALWDGLDNSDVIPPLGALII